LKGVSGTEDQEQPVAGVLDPDVADIVVAIVPGIGGVGEASGVA
jgi:hypothetical protein